MKFHFSLIFFFLKKKRKEKKPEKGLPENFFSNIKKKINK